MWSQAFAQRKFIGLSFEQPDDPVIREDVMPQYEQAKYPAIGWIEGEQGPGRWDEEDQFQSQADNPRHRDGRFPRAAGVAFDIERAPGGRCQQRDEDHQGYSQDARELRSAPGAQRDQGKDLE